MSERLPGAEAARRNDLAMDVARLWMATRGRLEDGWEPVGPGLKGALDRLADAYDFNASEENR